MVCHRARTCHPKPSPALRCRFLVQCRRPVQCLRLVCRCRVRCHRPVPSRHHVCQCRVRCHRPVPSRHHVCRCRVRYRRPVPCLRLVCRLHVMFHRPRRSCHVRCRHHGRRFPVCVRLLGRLSRARRPLHESHRLWLPHRPRRLCVNCVWDRSHSVPLRLILDKFLGWQLLAAQQPAVSHAPANRFRFLGR